MRGNTFIPTVLASLAGMVLDLNKGMVNLQGMAKMLMTKAGVRGHNSWYQPTTKSPEINSLLDTTRKALKNPTLLRICQPPHAPHLILTHDSSHHMWGTTLDSHEGKPIAHTQQRWNTKEKKWHITTKETKASVRGTQALLHLIPPHSHVTLRTDNTTTLCAWNKGSKLPHINEDVREMKTELHKQGITVHAVRLPGIHNTRAGGLYNTVVAKVFTLCKGHVLGGWGQKSGLSGCIRRKSSARHKYSHLEASRVWFTGASKVDHLLAFSFKCAGGAHSVCRVLAISVDLKMQLLIL